MQDTDILTEAERILDEDLDLAEDDELNLSPNYDNELAAADYLTHYELWKGCKVKIMNARLNHKDDEVKTLTGEELVHKAILTRIKRDNPKAHKIALDVAEIRAKQFAESRESVRKGQQ